MLGGRAGKNTADLAYQGPLHPEPAGGIQKLAHLAAHVAETCRRTEDNGIGCRQVIHRGDRYMGHPLLGLHRPHHSQHLVREGFGDTFDGRLASGYRADTLGNRFGHPVDMAVHTVIGYQDLAHSILLLIIQWATINISMLIRSFTRCMPSRSKSLPDP